MLVAAGGATLYGRFGPKSRACGSLLRNSQGDVRVWAALGKQSA
jgi:hypothetical protein